MKITDVIIEGMAQDEAEEYSGWRAEFVNQINYNTFEVKMTNTRSRESANFVVRPVDMISHGPTLQIETMDVHDLQTGQTASWTSDDPLPDGGIVYAISGLFYDNKELRQKLWNIVDTHNTKGQDTMPGLDQRRSIGQEVDADAYIDSQEKTQDAMAKMKKGMTEGEGNFVGDFPQPNIGGATVKPMQVGDTVSYFGQTAKIQAQSPDRKHSRIEITKGTGGVVQTVLTSDLKRVHKGMAEGDLHEEASKLLSAQDKDGVITIIVQAPDGTKRSAASSNPNAINKWLMKYGLRLPKNIADLFVGVTEEFRPTTGQAMGIRSQIAQKMNPGSSKFIWKRPNQIMGSHTENELRALKFRYSAKHNAWGGTKQMWSRLEGTLKELAPSGAGRGGGNYFKTLASAWYNGAYDTGSLQKGIKSKQDVERLLQRGIVCPDGVTRKFGIDYNATDDGVMISSDDYYEHADHGKKPGTMIDTRTGQAWGPYDYMEFKHAQLKESLAEFSPTKPPTAGAFGGNKDYGQPTSSRYIGGNKFVLGTTNNYVLTATVDKWGLEWDEDNNIWYLDSPGAAHIADATEGEIELPAPQEQRNQIHDLVTDYLNDHNSAELQRVAAYYGHSADGEMATSEGVRVPAQQILGTKNRAKSAYYPTNVKPKVPRLQTPLTDKELTRLSQLAGIDTNK